MILFTLGILIIVRLGAQVPIPCINPEALRQTMESLNDTFLGRPKENGLPCKNGLAWAWVWPARAVIWSVLRIAKMVKCKKSVPRAFTKGNCLGVQNSPFFIIFTVKRNVLAHFWHLHLVIWELGWPGFPSET